MHTGYIAMASSLAVLQLECSRHGILLTRPADVVDADDSDQSHSECFDSSRSQGGITNLLQADCVVFDRALSGHSRHGRVDWWSRHASAWRQHLWRQALRLFLRRCPGLFCAHCSTHTDFEGRPLRRNLLPLLNHGCTWPRGLHAGP